MSKNFSKHLTVSTNKKQIYLIVHNVRSLFNVGAFFRTADVFGIEKIYLCGYTGTPPRDQISKVALGAEETVAWEKKVQTTTLIKNLKKKGVQVVALETGDKVTSLPKFKPKFPVALVVGHEVDGLPESILKLCDEIVEIPMIGQKESLNVSVAAGIGLYALRNK